MTRGRPIATSQIPAAQPAPSTPPTITPARIMNGISMRANQPTGSRSFRAALGRYTMFSTASPTTNASTSTSPAITSETISVRTTVMCIGAIFSLAQDEALDFAAGRFGQLVDELNPSWVLERLQAALDQRLKLGSGNESASAADDERARLEQPCLVWGANHGALQHVRVAQKTALNL